MMKTDTKWKAICRRSICFAICLSFALLSGCALTTARIVVNYSAEQNVAPVPGASDVVVGVTVVDERKDKTKVGRKQNGYGMPLAPIFAAEDVPATIRRAIEQELQARGFQIGEPVSVQVEVDLSRFYIRHTIGFFSGDEVADLNMAVAVKSKRGEVLYSRQIDAQGVRQSIVYETEEDSRFVLQTALQNGIRDLFGNRAFTDALVAASRPEPTSTRSGHQRSTRSDAPQP